MPGESGARIGRGPPIRRPNQVRFCPVNETVTGPPLLVSVPPFQYEAMRPKLGAITWWSPGPRTSTGVLLRYCTETSQRPRGSFTVVRAVSPGLAIDPVQVVVTTGRARTPAYLKRFR